jgi:predicted MFS family arabinose efflux permease
MRSPRRPFDRSLPRPLRHPAFLRVWLAGMLTYPARFADITTVAWLVTRGTDRPSDVALIAVFRWLPYLFAGPIVGVLIDRLPRLRVLRVALASMAGGAVVVGVLALTDRLEIWHLYAYTSFSGLTWTVDVPARRAYLRGVVGRRLTTLALALDQVTWHSGLLIGANLAGLLLDDINAGWVFVGVAAAVLLSLPFLRGLPRLSLAASSKTEPVLRSLLEGVRFVRSSRTLVGVLCLVAITNLFGFGFEAMTPVFAEDVLHASAARFGLLMSAQGLGSVLGGLMLIRFAPRVRRHAFVLMGVVIANHVASILLALSVWYSASFTVLVIAGISGNFFAIMSTSIFLLLTPDAMRGRVLGIHIFVIGCYPLGIFVLGRLADAIGPGPALAWMAAAGIGLACIVFAAFPELRRETRR